MTEDFISEASAEPPAAPFPIGEEAAAVKDPETLWFRE